MGFDHEQYIFVYDDSKETINKLEKRYIIYNKDRLISYYKSLINKYFPEQIRDRLTNEIIEAINTDINKIRLNIDNVQYIDNKIYVSVPISLKDEVDCGYYDKVIYENKEILDHEAMNKLYTITYDRFHEFPTYHYGRDFREYYEDFDSVKILLRTTTYYS